ncbi:Rne/Rng family ribonuclease [Frigoribacterium salinisoli]
MVENDTHDDGPDAVRPKRRRGLFAGLLARQAAPARRPASSDEPATIETNRQDDAQEASPVTNETEVAAEATTSTDPTSTDQATTGQGVVDQEAVDQTDPATAPDEPADAPEPEPEAASSPIPANLTTTSLIFHAPQYDLLPARPGRARRDDVDDAWDDEDDDDRPQQPSSRRRTRGRSGDREGRRREDRDDRDDRDDRQGRERPQRQVELITEPQKVKGSTRLEAKKQRRRDGRDAGRRRPVITEAEFLARRESVDRKMIVRSSGDRVQIGVMEDGTLAEHYVAESKNVSLIGNVYLGRVQNVLPSMEAAFIDIGRGRNAVLYSGEVDWDAVEHGNQPRRIELALKPGDRVLVQVSKDPVGHKGARLTSQISLPGRYLVYVPNGSMNGISRKLPDTERARLKKILKEALPENTGVIVRTAAEGATEEQLTLDVQRLLAQWADISAKVEKGVAPALLHSEPDLLIKIVRDVFNEDFHELVIDGDEAFETLQSYLSAVAPDLLDRVQRYEGDRDAFDEHRLNEQIEKALDRKVWLPSGGSLVIDRTEAMTVVDVNTGKFVGSGGNLEETVTKNNLEAAEEIVRQLRLRDIGGIIVVDFIDMVLESNRDLVLRRLVECLSRDRTKHQVAEVTSLGLVQMTRKKLGLGLAESVTDTAGAEQKQDQQPRRAQQEPRRRGKGGQGASSGQPSSAGAGAGRGSGASTTTPTHAITDDVKNALSRIAASTISAADDATRPAQAASEAAAAVEAAIDAAAAEAAARAAGLEAPTGPSEAPGTGPSADDGDGRRARSGRRGRRGRGPARDDEATDGTEPPQAATSEPTSTEQEAPAPSSAPVAPAEDPAPVGNAARTPAQAEPERPRRGERRRATSTGTTPDATVAILDLPVAATTRAPRRISPDAEQLLDSVLGALPEPAQPGQGRGRSRRASSAGTTAAPAPSASSSDDAPEGGPFILGVGVSSDEL